MLTDNQEAWLKALESGEFSQTKDYLQDSQGFCCLGVACKVAERAGVQVQKTSSGGLVGSSLGVQPLVMDWLGLRDSTGVPNDYTYPQPTHRSLTHYNDSGKTFKEIAKIIRDNPNLYFKETNADPSTREVAQGSGVG